MRHIVPRIGQIASLYLGEVAVAKSGFKVLDCDLHVIEPPDLWLRYISPEFKERAPRDIPEWWQSGMVGPDGELWGRKSTAVEGIQRAHTGRSFAGYSERVKPYREAGWSSEAQIAAMDDEGIDVAVLYPTNGLFALSMPVMEPRLAAAIARAYNNWLYDFCQADPDRLIGAGMISLFDIEDAVSETRRCVKELGFRGVFLRPNEANGRNWYDPYYEPLWAILEELDIPVGFHEGSGASVRQVGEQFGNNYMLLHTFCFPVELMLAAASLCAGGVLQRHPNLRVAFLEGNCSWLPFLLWRMDEQWERLGDVFAPEMKMAPSEYYKRQCFASAEADEEPVKYVVDYMGNDRLIFSTDFPHSDSKFPHAVERMLELPLTDLDKRKILWDNCADYYRINQ